MGKNNPKSTPQNSRIGWCLDLIQVLFPVFLLTYMVLILVETLFRGSVSSYLDLNYVLMIVTILGIASIITAPASSHNQKLEQLNNKNKLLIACAGIGSAAIIWYKTQQIGTIAYLISILGGGLVVFLSIFIWQGDSGRKTEEQDNQNS
jgi:hypothetical protein